MSFQSIADKQVLITSISQEFGCTKHTFGTAKQIIEAIGEGEELAFSNKFAIYSGFLMCENHGLLVTDEALEALSLEEVRAITLHEMGHFVLKHAEKIESRADGLVLNNEIEIEADAFAVTNGAKASALVSGLFKVISLSFDLMRDDLLSQGESAEDLDVFITTAKESLAENVDMKARIEALSV